MGSWTSSPQRVARPINRKAGQRRSSTLVAVILLVAMMGFAYPKQPFLFIPAQPTKQVVDRFKPGFMDYLYKDIVDRNTQ